MNKIKLKINWSCQEQPIPKDCRVYKGWPVSRKFRHSVVGPHPPPPPHYKNFFMLWVRANLRPRSFLRTPIFVGRSGLGFALTQSIAEIQHSWDIFNYWDAWVLSRLCFELEQIRDHFAQQIWGVLRKQSGLRFSLTQSIKKLCVVVVVGGAQQQSDGKSRKRAILLS